MFKIPNAPDAAFADQAEPDQGDIDILVGAHNRTGVISGCAVTAQGTPDMTVAVAAGTAMVLGLTATVSSGNLTIGAADATNPRFDLIAIDGAGAKSVIAGTPASNAVFPAVPTNKAIIASVYVPANDTTINTNQIIDKRMLISDSPFIQQANPNMVSSGMWIELNPSGTVKTIWVETA